MMFTFTVEISFVNYNVPKQYKNKNSSNIVYKLNLRDSFVVKSIKSVKKKHLNTFFQVKLSTSRISLM